ncbi:putative secreted protein (Por secretion system target) [Gillisia mitskevichiae]|uniref:Putative secreted protein (Por secretion system target) n=1 Tax=Gillisia mitskevichiae TaxID=270921 RepID=A0A495P438_9FLAO|nr:LamG-like jellyroll fold domain-containing protein [Gillisia mitskevichiae]RKS43449.1 putative secreted protein (Por secretion system target) [Gillisia mitskevichiae]
MGKITLMGRNPLLSLLFLASSLFINIFANNINEEIIISGNISELNCNNVNNAAITISVSGGTAPYTYLWNDANTSKNRTNLPAGSYKVTVTDALSITASKTFVINSPTAIIINSLSKTNISCFNGNDGVITAGSVSGGNNNYEYSINGTNFQSSNTFSNLTAGNYTITVRDSNNCRTSNTTSLTEPNQLSMQSSSFIAVSCNGKSDGSITIGTGTGGSGAYTYSIDGNNFKSSRTFNDLIAGTYTITVKDDNNCEISENITITEPSLLSMQTSSTTSVSCKGKSDGSITAGEVVGGNGNYTYSINGSTFQSSNLFSNLSAGNYTLSVKDLKNCEISEIITINEPAALEVMSPTIKNTTCNGASDGTIVVGTASGGNGDFKYSLDGTNYQNDNFFENLPAGNYVIYVKDKKGCEITMVTNVDEPSSLLMQPSTYSPVSCNGAKDGKIIAGEVTGGSGTYQYSIDGISFSSNNTFTELNAGNYTLQVKDLNDCTTEEDIIISQPDTLSAIPATFKALTCFGANDGSIIVGTVIGGNGGYEFSIDGTNFQTNNTFSNLPGGNYTLTIRDSKNCLISETITIAEPIALKMESAEITNVNCYDSGDGEIVAGTVTGGNGGYEYSLDGINFTTSNTFNELNVGNHTITVRDVKGCTVTETVTLTGPQILVMDPATKTDISCHGASDATVTAGAVRGGTTGYQYSIDGVNFGSETTFKVLYAGTYTLTVRDLNGCKIERIIEINEPEPLISEPASSTAAACVGNNSGTITAGSVTGGNGEYLYSIDNTNFNNTGIFTDVAEGSYTIFIKDSKGCATQSDVIVAAPEALDANIVSTNVNCFNGSDGTLSINNATGGHGAFEYCIDGTTWQTDSKFTALTAGTYSVKIRDLDYPSCEITLSNNTIITQPAATVSVQVTTTRTTSYGTSTGTATANASGGTPGFTYAWRKINEATVLQTTKTANGLAAGNYEVTVTDKNGCSQLKELKIIEAIKAPIIPTSICPEDEDVIRTSYFEVEDLTAIGGVGPYTYLWNFGEGATPQTATGPGSHVVKYNTSGNRTITVEVKDSTGAVKTESIIQYVGECFKDDCGSNDFAINSFYMADASGNKITAATCGNGQPKFLFFDLPTNSTRYSLYIEYIFTIEHADGTLTNVNRGLCFYEKEAIPTKVKTIEIDWECGDLLTIENVYLTFSNNRNWKCGQGPKPKCYSTNNNEVVITPLYARATPNELLCNGSNNGIVTVKANGGQGPYQYSITSATSGFLPSNEFYNLIAGNYTVWVKDNEGTVFKAAPVTINQPLSPIILSVTSTNPICFGETGRATVSATGGSPFQSENAENYYTYLWNDATEQTTATAINLTNGEYTITVIDKNGCQAIEKVTIVEPAQISKAIAGEDQNFSCGFKGTNLSANIPEEGTGTWTIISGTGGQISEPNNPQSYFTGTAGNYTLQWTIANETNTCTTNDQMLISFTEDCSTLDFDGVDDHVTMENNYNLSSGNFTIEAWVKLNSLNGQRTIVSKRDSQNLSAGGYDLSINSGSPTFRWGNSTVTSSYKLTTARWYHVAVIFTNGQAKLYVDGIKVGNGSASNPTATSSPFLIGAIFRGNKPENPVNYFHGWIEEVRIWKTALQEEQLRFMMNQRLKVNVTPVTGTVLPLVVPGDLAYNNLEGYYQLIGSELSNGFTPDKSINKVDGLLKNIETTQENSAPLPYISKVAGQWRSKNTWQRPDVWDAPNSLGINGEPINWNIAQIAHDITSGGKDIYMLGLLSQIGELNMANPNQTLNENNSGQGLTITHYLDLNGSIDLVGESQLVQTEGSILAPTSAGFIERDQQGTANSYNYNYWSSPVVDQGTSNSTYMISKVMLDGTDTNNPKNIMFGNGVTFADGKYSNPRMISNYWIWKFRGTADEYSEWKHIGSNGVLKIGEGYTMKGTSGDASIADRQNYVYKGKPNNGTITLNISQDQNYLLGNPYPSAIDAKKFILDNIKDSGGLNNVNVFTGAVYFWDHFAGKTHILREYVGGYATYNLIGGVKAIAMDDRINSNSDAVASKTPGQYIPVGQGFFINSMPDPSLNGLNNVVGGDIVFKNSQRVFAREAVGSSQFLAPEKTDKANKEAIALGKIRINFRSPKGYRRELLVGINPNATNGYDLGYDAPLNEYNVEDMFWLIKDHEFVIQGVSNFDVDQVLPIGMMIDEEGPINIGLKSWENLPDDKMVYIHDKWNDSIHDIKEIAYETTMKPGYIVDRFALIFFKEKETITPIDTIQVPMITPKDCLVTMKHNYRDNEIQILNNEEIQIDNLYLYDLNGKLLVNHSSISNSKEVRISIKNYPSGVYIVKLKTTDKLITQKIIIKN